MTNDSQFVYLTWEENKSDDKYDSPLKNIIISYDYGEYSRISGEITIEPNIKNASLKVESGPNIRITIYTVDELGNKSAGKKIQDKCDDGFITATQEDAKEKIEKMHKDGKIIINGICDINSLNEEFVKKNNNMHIRSIILDLSGVENLYSLDETFYNCQKISKIILPNTVTTIGNYAFAGCINLSSVNIPDSVTKIGKNAFYGCKKLENINIPEGVTSIGEYAFGLNPITKITIPQKTTFIGNNAFYNCSELKNVTLNNYALNHFKTIFVNSTNNITSIIIQDDTTEIPEFVFAGKCEKLNSVKIPDGITSIGAGAFSGCKALSNINIPENVTSIGYYAFNHCENLQKVNIPKGITSIEKETFFYCSSLPRIIIPESVTSIGKDAFASCLSLEYVTFNDTTSVWYSSSYDKNSNLIRKKLGPMSEVDKQENAQKLKEGAFLYNSNYKKN
jgi:hypothetical protein